MERLLSNHDARPYRPVYGDLQITFLDVLQLTRYHKNIIDNECSAVSILRQATREL